MEVDGSVWALMIYGELIYWAYLCKLVRDENNWFGFSISLLAVLVYAGSD